MRFKKTYIVSFILILAVSCVNSPKEDKLSPLLFNLNLNDPSPSPPPKVSFQDAVNSIRGKVGIRGMSATIIDSKGVALSAASNMPGLGNPVSTDQLFGLGSMTKTYTAYCIFKLIESTKNSSNPLTLDSEINTWLYEGSDPPLDDSIKAVIDPSTTVGQLMNHTSGVYDYQYSILYTAAMLGDTNKLWSPLDILAYVDNPNFLPGAEYSYSNSNFILLGMIIERLTGGPVLSVFHDQVTVPYGFSHTFMRTLEPVIGEMAIGYERDINGNYYLVEYLIGSGNSLFSSSWTCGNIVTTSGELARWMKIYYSYQKSYGYIDGPAYKRFWNKWDNPDLTKLCAECTSEYGLCMMRFDLTSIIPGCIVYGHWGQIPGYTGFLAYWPAKDISVAALLNDQWADRYKVLVELLKYLGTIY